MAGKVAIVYDWLTQMGGAEPVVLELHKLFPQAPIYTSVFDYEKMTAFGSMDVRTTYLQKLPKKLRYKHTLQPTLRPRAFRKLDLSEFDIIISSSSAEAKAVRKTRANQTHIAYIHTPIRYYYSHYNEFKKEFQFGKLTPLIRPFIPLMVRWMRKLDLASVKDIDILIANSTITQERIKKYYHRDSVIVHPPVDVKKFLPTSKTKRHGLVIWGRHVPYKRFDLAIEACNKLGIDLTIAGAGSDTERLKKLAGPTIKFVGRISDAELVKLAHHSEAFLFPNEEDFGIAAVEALAAGLPIIAYAKGGALDIVTDNETGILFHEQTTESLIAAIQKFQTTKFNQINLTNRAKRFDRSFFDAKIKKIVADSTK